MCPPTLELACSLWWYYFTLSVPHLSLCLLSGPMFGNYCMYVIYHMALAMFASLRCQVSDSDPLLSSWLDTVITPCT